MSCSGPLFFQPLQAGFSPCPATDFLSYNPHSVATFTRRPPLPLGLPTTCVGLVSLQWALATGKGQCPGRGGSPQGWDFHSSPRGTGEALTKPGRGFLKGCSVREHKMKPRTWAHITLLGPGLMGQLLSQRWPGNHRI